MKKIMVIPCLLLTVTLFHCKKSKDDEGNGPNLKKGLLAYFPLNDSFLDSTGQCEITTSVSTVLPAFDRHNESSALFFADKGKFIFTTNEWKAGPISISLWLKDSDLAGDNLFMTSNNDYLDMHQKDNNIGLGIKVSAQPARAYAPITKQWTHYAATYDGTWITAYINGSFKNKIKQTGTPVIITEVSVGSNQKNGVWWNGTIDDLRFYDRVLSEDEVKILAAL